MICVFIFSNGLFCKIMEQGSTTGFNVYLITRPTHSVRCLMDSSQALEMVQELLCRLMQSSPSAQSIFKTPECVQMDFVHRVLWTHSKTTQGDWQFVLSDKLFLSLCPCRRRKTCACATGLSSGRPELVRHVHEWHVH